MCQQVDVDLASAVFGGLGASIGVSRQAALLALGGDGVWRLRVLGRAPLRVNGIMVSTKQASPYIDTPGQLGRQPLS